MSRTMGDSHKRFLQTIMSKGIISASQAVALHKHCCETHGGMEETHWLQFNQILLDHVVFILY